jgi:FkbM family methyltransferase
MAFEIEHLRNKVYYSQNREDLLLEAFFPDIKDGFYIDVGAYDPDYDSVTKLFYKKGWSGINIEPQQGRYKKFASVRKRDINLNLGVSDKKGKLTLRAYENGGLSTFSDEIKDSYSDETDPNVQAYEDVTVPVTTLKDVLTKHAPNKIINFMKVDVEGLEYEVLAGNDWNSYRPQVLCIEANHIVRDWKQLLRKNGYKCVFFDGLNEYYVDMRDKTMAQFDYVKHILTVRGGGIGYDDYHNVKMLNDQFKKMNREASEKIAKLESEARQQQQKIIELERILNNPRILARKLAKLVAHKVRRVSGGANDSK